MSRRLLIGLISATASAIFAVPIPGQQVSIEEERAKAEAEAWRLYEGAALAPVLAGCFSVRHQTTWSADSLRYPDRFELSRKRVGGMGYHHSGTFATDLPVMDEAGYPPIWRPLGLDTLYIDPDPTRAAGPSYDAYLHTTTEAGAFVLETYWFGDRPMTGDDPARGRLVGRAYGARVDCAADESEPDRGGA